MSGLGHGKLATGLDWGCYMIGSRFRGSGAEGLWFGGKRICREITFNN